MADEKQEPVTALVIKGTGSGFIDVPNSTTSKDGMTTVQTPDGQPNIVYQFISTTAAVLARATTIFIQTLLGNLGVTIGNAIAPNVIPQSSWKVAALIALSATAVNVLQSLLTISTNLEKKFPLLRA